MTNKIKNLTCDDEGRWSWTLVDSDADTSVDMCTNQSGEGIWEHALSNSWNVDSDGTRQPNYQWRQKTGTGQFSLSGCSTIAARGRILRYFNEP